MSLTKGAQKMLARISAQASSLYGRKLSKGRPASAGFDTNEFRYMHMLKHLEGKNWPLCQNLQGRESSQYVYVLAPDLTHDHRGDKIQSKVFAVPAEYVIERIDDGITHNAPPSTEHMQYQMYLAKGMHTVKVLAPWTDGFCALAAIAPEE